MLNPAVWFLGATAAVIASAMALWKDQQHNLVDARRFQLTPDRIAVNLPGGLVGTDVKNEFFRRLMSPPNLLATELVPAAARAFEQIPWVEYVNSIEKVPAGLKVDLTYRTPVAVIDVRETPPFTIDKFGFVIDESMLDQDLRKTLLRIAVPHLNRSRIPETWQRWEDNRIRGAASIAALLKDQNVALGLYWIVSFQVDDSGKSAGQLFELWPAGHGAKIIWGIPSETASHREASPEQKISAIREFVLKVGPLDSQDGNKKIDVRTGKPILTQDNRTADRADFLRRVK
jgi:hypothetical protein